jgi:hypothetical protein
MLLACGDDAHHSGAGAGGGDPAEAREVDALAARLEGIYEVTFHETNLDACELGGLLTGSHGFFALMTRSSPNLSLVDVVSCPNVEECRELPAKWLKSSITTTFHFTFGEATGETSLAGTFTISVQEGQQCHHRLTDATLVETAPGELRIEARLWRGEDYPVRSDGQCDLASGEGPSMEEPCMKLTVLEASLVEGPS